MDKPNQTQACCFSDGHCEDLTATVCREQGGTPQDAGTDCANTQCPQPTGACCLADGSCTELTEARCLAAGGTFQGPGSDCTTVDCSECTWQPNDLHKMHWPQRPKTGGWDVEFGSSVLADDWMCSESGPVEDLHFWISWMKNQQTTIPGFTISIYSDVPDWDGDGPAYSIPGQPLWSAFFEPGMFTVHDMPADMQGWFDPCEAFVQQGTEAAPIVYWLSVQAQWSYPPGISLLRRFGWNTSYQSWNDAAVWSQSTAPHEGIWQKLPYPSGHGYYNELPVNLAFQITTSDLSFTELIQHQVADDWQCETKDPVTAAVWWGSYVGHKVQPYACQVLPEPNKPDFFEQCHLDPTLRPEQGDPQGFVRLGDAVFEYLHEAQFKLSH